MAYQLSAAALAATAAGLRAELSSCKLEIFAGAKPTNESIALNMSTTHTKLVTLTVDNDGSTGLTFAVPTDGTLSKTSSETWLGSNIFSGAQADQETLTPVFFRLGLMTDDLTAAGAGPRIQGTVGGENSAADLKLLSSTITAGSGNTTGLAGFNVRITPLGG